MNEERDNSQPVENDHSIPEFQVPENEQELKKVLETEVLDI